MHNLTLAEIARNLAEKRFSAEELTRTLLARIEQLDPQLNSFISVTDELAIAQAKAADARRAAGENGALLGAPIGHKDLFCTQGIRTSCGSRILDSFKAPYDATVVERLAAAGTVTLGKLNMDEFAMGSANESSYYGPVKNPWDLSRVPGGSSGGSAAAIAARLLPAATGTDTGGSIRQPAALTNTVGVKPTYGTVSRYGLIAAASSLDQAGPCGRTVLDTALLHEVIAGHDAFDATSVDRPVAPVVAAAREGAKGDLSGVKVGLIKQFERDGWQEGVMENYHAAVDQLREQGAEIVEVDCPHFDDALAAYYLIMPCEVSSNLARFDGMRYGLRAGDDGSHSAEQVMSQSRAEGFGPEVKRRIMLGTYALSVGYYDAYYLQAQRVRTLIAQDFARAFEQVDVLVSPTTPTTAFKLGEKAEDPMAMYNFDLCTLPLNLAGLCGMSVPSGMASDTNLPTGLQIMAPAFEDDRLYKVGAAYEAGRDK